MSPLRLLLASALCVLSVARCEGANHLVGPGAVSTYGGGGGRRRATSYVRVQDPAAGFFVGGSSNEGVNGLYARTERLPASLAGTRRRFSLLYVHMDSGWHLGFAESVDDARASEMEWVFIDAAGRDHMLLPENTLIPAAGERWSKVPREPERRRSRWTSGSWSWSTSAAEDPRASSETRVEAAPRAGADADDVDELPWQLIAVLSDDMLSNLAGHKRHHDSLVARALNCHPPTAPAGADSEDIAPPPEATADAERLAEEAEEAAERGNHEEAAELYAAAIDESLRADAAADEDDANRRAEARSDGDDHQNQNQNQDQNQDIDIDIDIDIDRRRLRSSWTRAVLGARLAGSYRRVRRLGEARARVDAALRSHPNYADALFQSALIRLDAGHPARAEDDLAALACVDRAYPDLQTWTTRARARTKRTAAWESARARDRAAAAANAARLLDIERGATRHCTAWRQTGGCDPNGPREETRDAPCDETVGRGRSGFCECVVPPGVDEGRFDGRLERPARLTCAHAGGRTCAEMCREAWDAEMARLHARVAEAEGMEAEGTKAEETKAKETDAEGTHRAGDSSATLDALRASLDAMRAWERAEAVVDASSNGDSSEEDGSSSDATGLSTSTTWPEEGWPDHYVALELPADFTDAELRASYRRVSLRAHPDKPGGSMRAFQRVAESYETLSDEDSRRAYDLGLGLGEPDGDSGEERTVWDEVERERFPERAGFTPFGDPLERKRKYEARRGGTGSGAGSGSGSGTGSRWRGDEF